MNRSVSPLRYTDAAIALHWLIAITIFGLLAVGKFMVSLELDDPLRFSLTQWHKSFGITVLLLSLIRLVWRFAHRAPPLPEATPVWQRRAAGVIHALLYSLLFVLPLTGWIYVSASPLNVDTILFGVIPWPHLPILAELDGRESISELFSELHEWAGYLLIVLLLLHVGAALKHQLIERDNVLQRMWPDWRQSSTRRKALAGVAAIALASSGLYFAAAGTQERALVAAGEADVRFTTNVAGSLTEGVFTDTRVEAALDASDAAASYLVAEVNTASYDTDNMQVNGSLGDPDWFDVDQHPQSRFESTRLERAAEGPWQVEGTLTLKGVSQPVAFEMTEQEDEAGNRFAIGRFTVNRLDFDVGAGSQPDDSTVAFEVDIEFRFPLGSPASANPDTTQDAMSN